MSDKSERERVKVAVVHLLITMQRVVDALRALGVAWDDLAHARLAENPEHDDAWRLPVEWPFPHLAWETMLGRFVSWLDYTVRVTGQLPPAESARGWETGYVWALANVHRNKGLKPDEVRMLLELARLDPKDLPPGVDSDELNKLLSLP